MEKDLDLGRALGRDLELDVAEGLAMGVGAVASGLESAMGAELVVVGLGLAMDVVDLGPAAGLGVQAQGRCTRTCCRRPCHRRC